MTSFTPRPWRAEMVLGAMLAASASTTALAQSNLAPDGPQQTGTTPNSNSANSTPADTSAVLPVQPAVEPPGGNRVLGVLPNYRTADKSLEGTTISAGHKMKIAAKDSFDYPLMGIGAAFAGLGQLTDQNPSFGQG